MKILAIETSCDETSIGIIEAKGGLRAPRFFVHSNIVASQIKVHRPYGGVVPNLAKREHIANLPVVLDQALLAAGVIDVKKEIDLIAVTVGPGLEPALWAGINFAEDLHRSWNIPLVGANHLEGHLYSFLLSQQQKDRWYALKTKNLFPAIALIVSGGHTQLMHMQSMGQLKLIGQTRDDAAGEAFDKVARMLGLSYPGGVEIEKLSQHAAGWEDNIEFPRPMISSGDLDFSFSGLKTAVLYYLREHPRAWKKRIATAFQNAVIDVLTTKTMQAARKKEARSIFLSGGVAANTALRHSLQRATEKASQKLFVAPIRYNTDNAAMIAVAAYIAHHRDHSYPLKANGNLNLKNT